uniref:Uncharacterized protein n=1 Tax=Scleropages formosus TaxID=113540 RepID=A0A8C9RGL8_SCLFO
MREGQVQDLVMVLLQGLNLHTWDAVKEPPEFPIPGHSRSGDTVVAVKELPPEKLISGHSQPLATGEATNFTVGPHLTNKINPCS